LLIDLSSHVPSFENRKKVYKLNIIFQETDGKLKRWLKLGLLRYWVLRRVADPGIIVEKVWA
jgi:hypothetical protein